MKQNVVLDLKGISKTFTSSAGLWASVCGRVVSVHALRGIDLEVHAGEIVGVVGESGSGKSTLANIILGLEKTTTGHMVVEGQDTSAMRQRERKLFRRRVQMIFQDPSGSLNPRFTIGQTVEEPLITNGFKNGVDRRKRVLEALEEAELRPAESYIDRFPHELSGGQRQRVAIARAIILRPSVLIADEPVSMLDVSVRAGILRLLSNLVRQHSMSLIFITHDLSLIGSMCDRVVIMYRGSIVESGQARPVMKAPQHPYTRQLIAAVPIPDPDWVPPPLTVRAGSEETPLAGCRFAPRCDYALPRCQSEEPLQEGPENHQVACLRSDEPALISPSDGIGF